MSDDPIQLSVANFRANIKTVITHIKSAIDDIEARSLHRNPGLTTDLTELLASSPKPDLLRECKSCLQTFPLNNFPWIAHHHGGLKRPLTVDESADQTASDSVCFDCWAMYLSTHIQDKMPLAIHEIKCAECDRSLGPKVIEALSTADTFNVYLEKQTQALLSTDPDFHWCPTPTCTNGFYIDPTSSFTPCPACSARLCNSCAVTWHTGESCQEFQARTTSIENETLTEETVSRISKPCPNTACGVRIRKSGGCDHVTCTQCMYQFCWRCGAPYRGDEGIFGPRGNAAHLESCEWYRPNRQDREAVRRFEQRTVAREELINFDETESDESDDGGDDDDDDEGDEFGGATAAEEIAHLYRFEGGREGREGRLRRPLDPDDRYAEEAMVEEALRRIGRHFGQGNGIGAVEAPGREVAEQALGYVSPDELENEYRYGEDGESDYEEL